MKSIFKVLSSMTLGAVIGGLAVHCLHLQAENDTLTDILLDGDDCEECCGCCAECLGYDFPEDGCEACMFSGVCPDRLSSEDSEDAGDAAPGSESGCDDCADCSGCGSESGSEGK